jgi:predicted O-methyltransferase YrrM
MQKYKYTQSWFLRSEIYNKVLQFVNINEKHSILEIGCYEGLSSVFFSDNLLNNPESTLVCIDPFLSVENNDHKELLLNNQEANFDYNISHSNNFNKVTIHKITSDEFFKFNNKKYNFIYIDGCHEPDFIQRDMENSFKCLETNGIMWMDDYRFGNGNVKIVMDNFVEKYTKSSECKVIHIAYQLAIRKL